MKVYKQGMPLLILLSFFISCSQKSSLEWSSFSWVGDTISGQYIEKAYLCVPVKIDSLPYEFNMQLDLGTNQTVLYGNVIDPYLEDHISLAGKLDSVDLFNGIFRNVTLYLGTEELAGMDIGYMKYFGDELPKDSIYTKTSKHIGTVAYDLFRDKVLMIDYKSGRFAVSNSLPAEYKHLVAEEFELTTNGMIKLPFHINRKKCKLIFDTGSSPFQLVTTKERALEISDTIIRDSLSGPLWWGREITFYGLDVNKPVEFGGKVFENSKVYYEKNGLWDEHVFQPLNVWGLTGNAYFFDHTVIIDYKNKLFRVK